MNGVYHVVYIYHQDMSADSTEQNNLTVYQTTRYSKQDCLMVSIYSADIQYCFTVTMRQWHTLTQRHTAENAHLN